MMNGRQVELEGVDPNNATDRGDAIVADELETAVEGALAQRARVAMEQRSFSPDPADRTPPDPAARTPDPALLGSLERHLLAGETHYPARPGMVELREGVGSRLPYLGYPGRDADGILITASEGESLLVALLGIGAVPNGTIIGSEGGRHQGLFAWLGTCLVEPGDGSSVNASARYRESGSRAEGLDTRESTGGGSERTAPGPDAPEAGEGVSEAQIHEIHAVGDRLFHGTGDASARLGESPSVGAPTRHPDAIVIGSLAGLEGMRPFHLGFVAAEPETLARITKWKQASSICSPAPSQRAALWALGVRP